MLLRFEIRVPKHETKFPTPPFPVKIRGIVGEMSGSTFQAQ